MQPGLQPVAQRCQLADRLGEAHRAVADAVVVEVVVAHGGPRHPVLVVGQAVGQQRAQRVEVAAVHDVGAPADRHLPAQSLGVVVPVGDEDRLVGLEVEPVQAHRRDVGDHRVAAREHREDVPLPDRRVAGLGVALGGALDQVQDGLVALADRRDLAGGHLRVRLVDQPHVGQGEHGAHDLRPEHVDRGVVVVLGVALPGRGVQHGASVARRQQGSGAQVELGPADPHQPALVELHERRSVPLHRRLARDEHPVVGLGVVADHALLVALAVVDVHVQHPAVEQRVEVEHRVVAVHDDLRVEVVVQRGEVGEAGGVVHRERGPLLDDGAGRPVPRDDPHRMALGEPFEDGHPLQQLVGARGVVGEVREDVGLLHHEILGPPRSPQRTEEARPMLRFGNLPRCLFPGSRCAAS